MEDERQHGRPLPARNKYGVVLCMCWHDETEDWEEIEGDSDGNGDK